MSISLPKDAEGYVGRSCPDCAKYFKIKPGTGLPGKDLPCTCPYCGRQGPTDDYHTKEQAEYAKSVLARKVSDELHRALKGMEFDHRPTGGFGIGMSLKVTRGTPIPIQSYREKTLETQVECESCRHEFAVYGVYGYCPDCREHNSLQTLSKNLDLARRLLSMSDAESDPAMKRKLVEEALGSCVSAFDSFGREACRVRVAAGGAEEALKIRFQDLEGASKRYEKAFGVSLASLVEPDEWKRLVRGFQKRHVIEHRSGVVDQEYITKSGDSIAVVGRLVPLEAPEIVAIGELLRRLGEGIAKPSQRTGERSPQ